MTAAPSIFQLAPLPYLALERGKQLEDVGPRFVLPPLDEHASGSERLLGSLRGGSRYGLQELKILSPEELPEEMGYVVKEENEGDGVNVREEEDGELWRRALEEPVAGPSGPRTFEPLRTWDRDLASQLDPRTTPFLSEKATFAFDSLLTALEPPITLPNIKTTSTPIQDPTELLKLMMRATMGTVTTDHLVWDARKSRFAWKEGGGRPMGVGKTAAASSMDSLLSVGTAIRRLEVITDSQSTLPLTPTHHALLHALSTYLTFIKQRLTTAIDECVDESTSSWNKWMSATTYVRQLGETLCEVMCWPLNGSTAQALPSRASSLLTHLYSHLFASLSTSPNRTRPTPLALAYLLSQSSTPFLTVLHAWVGLSPGTSIEEDADPEAQPWADLGITRKLKSTGDDGWEYEFSAGRMPEFVPKDVRRTLFEAGRSLRLLREASGGGHPLCGDGWGVEPRWEWGSGSSVSAGDMRSHVRRVRKEVEHWRKSVRDRTRSISGSLSTSRLRAPAKKERKRIPLEFRDTAPPSPAQTTNATGSAASSDIDDLWALFNQAPGSHLQTLQTTQPDVAAPSSNLWAPTPLESLHTFIAHHSSPSNPLLPFDSPTLPIFISTHLLAPLLTHSTLISTSLVSLYLDDLLFLDHLDILRAFWLGGDVGFMERSSGALFGKDTAGAGEALGLGRRARTRARMGISGGDEPVRGLSAEGDWGIGLGIGLSERSRWPPGGAELAYALRTTLLDDGGAREEDKAKGPVWEGVEDRVSFAIRELPEEGDSGRRARWLNPQAIEALDFLYLSYSPPPAISVLLPPSLMAKYQLIHNLTLRLSRVDLVLRTMYWDIIHPSPMSLSDEPVKIGVDSGFSRPRPSSRASTRSHDRPAMSIFPRDSKVERHLQRLKFRMNHLVTAYMRYMADSAIAGKWGVMRRRLGKLRGREGTEGKKGSRAGSPAGDDEGDFYEDEALHAADDGEEEEGDEGEDDDARAASLHQLQSIHSLVLYHHLTLDKILRACLLGPQPGQQVTFNILMTLLGLVLDLGKTVKEVKGGVLGWEDGAEKVAEIGKEWEEKEAVFLHALERLSLRTATTTRSQATEGGNETEQDMQVLLGGEGGASDEASEAHARVGMGGNDLQELLLRLRLGDGVEGKGGRWKKDEGV
ncbi:hypothetical protein IAT38_004274 [Cryptococcus sp. DSM 104549]